jgi:two-component system chemotaxis sensor kinase CheA
MIRNAFDHGLECPEIRRRREKNPCGMITLTAHHDGASLVIQLADDGAGLDRERIAARVRSLELAVEPERLSDEKLFNFIFEPGFSTAEKVSDLSGRGVGMDVVRRNIEALRGTIRLESHPGEGTAITIRLPLTLVIIEGFAVSVGNETYVLPFQAVLECIEFPEQARRRDGARGVINLRGEPLPYVRLRNWLGLANGHFGREHVVVIETDSGKAGLVVDALHGVRQTVIKPLGKRFHGLPLLAGSTILASGRVALILDVHALIRDVINKEPTHER